MKFLEIFLKLPEISWNFKNFSWNFMKFSGLFLKFSWNFMKMSNFWNFRKITNYWIILEFFSYIIKEFSLQFEISRLKFRMPNLVKWDWTANWNSQPWVISVTIFVRSQFTRCHLSVNLWRKTYQHAIWCNSGWLLLVKKSVKKTKSR